MRSTNNKIFIDTNILIYSLDQFNPEKKLQARSILNRVMKHHTGVISTQVMQEFYVGATQKMHGDPVIIKGVLNQLLHFELIQVSPELIFSAIDCSILNRLSFWDALIISTAASARCEEIWTEDLNHNQIVLGVRIVNPFI